MAQPFRSVQPFEPKTGMEPLTSFEGVRFFRGQINLFLFGFSEVFFHYCLWWGGGDKVTIPSICFETTLSDICC